jgi:iron complex outermembrane receptor protein
MKHPDRRRPGTFKVTIALIAGSLTAAPGVFAQEDQSSEGLLEEIIVTAERRAESLQEVPMSVIAISGNQVNPAEITGLTDIAHKTPNFKYTEFNLAEPQVYIRGIGSTNDSGASDPAVAVFLDDVYLGRPGGAAMDLYDIERIEVLRGPQGTLYGKNAAGGTINFVTRKPQREFEAKAGVTVGSDSLVQVGAYVNGPISDTVAGKLVVNRRTRDGFAKNITTGQDLEDDDTTSARGQLLITPSDRVDILLGFDYTDIDNAGANRYVVNFDIPGLTALSQIPALLDRQELANEGLGLRESSHEDVQYATKELTGFLARVDADLGWATLTSISAYREAEMAWFQALVPVLSSLQGGPGIYEVDDWADQESEQISQEFRLSSEGDRLKWVLGLYYLDEDVDRTESFFTYWEDITPLAGLSPGDVTFNQKAGTTSTAVFGQLTWNLAETVDLTLGARYTRDEKDIFNEAIDNLDGIPPTGIPLVGAPYVVSAKESWDDTTLRASLEWMPTDDAMLYLTYSEGFKSGAFNGTQGSPVAASSPLDPETATNIEVGAKTQWYGDRLRFNFAYFDLDYDDLQVWFLQNNVLVAANATASVDGFEADFAVAFTENFRLSGGFGTLDGKYDEYEAGADNFTGNDLPRTPDSSWTLAADYTIPFGNGEALRLLASASYTDEFNYEPSNDPRQEEPDVTVFDASVRFTSADDRWNLTAWGKNLGDELYGEHGISGTFGGASRIWAPPRTWGVSFDYRWD